MRARPFVAPGLLRVVGATASGDFYAFGYSDPDLYAWTVDNTGAWVSDRGSVSQAGLVFQTPASIIYEDSAGNVGDGSLIMLSGGYDDAYGLWVYDVGGDALYSYTAPSGWRIGGGAYYNGFVYWAENETTPDGGGAFDVRLRKADCDLTNESTVQTYSFTADAGATTPFIDAFGLAATSALVWVGSRGGNPGAEYRMIRFPLSGAAASDRDYGSDSPAPNTGRANSIGMPNSAGLCIMATFDEPFAFSQEDGTGAGMVAIWPDWSELTPPSGSYPAASVDPTGTLFTIYTLSDSALNGDFCAQDDAATTVAADPSLTFFPDEHPVYAIRPAYLFYYGG